MRTEHNQRWIAQERTKQRQDANEERYYWMAVMIAEKKSIRRVRIDQEQGLHLRAAATFSQVARHFACDIRVTCGDRQADGGSMWEFLGLVAQPGCELILEANGPESEAALDRLSALVAARFHSPVVEDGRERT